MRERECSRGHNNVVAYYVIYAYYVVGHVHIRTFKHCNHVCACVHIICCGLRRPKRCGAVRLLRGRLPKCPRASAHVNQL